MKIEALIELEVKMATEDERMQILDMIESGKITASQGVALLVELEKGNAADRLGPRTDFEGGVGSDASSVGSPPPGLGQVPEPAVKPVPADRTAEAGSPSAGVEGRSGGAEIDPSDDDNRVKRESLPHPSLESWRRWWWIPMWAGVGITFLSAALMFVAWQATGIGFWFACTWFPFLLGIGVMALAWGSRNLPWLHIRIRQTPKTWSKTLAISFPMPVRLSTWFVRKYAARVHITENDEDDELLLALDKATPDAPYFMAIEDGEAGNRVEIYIG